MFDIIHEDLFLEKNSIETLLELNYSSVYVCKNVKKKEDIKDFSFPKSNQLIFKKAYLFDDVSLVNLIKDKNALILVRGGDIKSNTAIVSNKSIKVLFNPIGIELCFDEGLAEISKQNNKTVCFNINEIRTNQYKAIKQMTFIINLLKLKGVDMKFITMAKKSNELIDSKILDALLLNFNLEKEMIKSILNKEI